jgi:hypothetical protein
LVTKKYGANTALFSETIAASGGSTFLTTYDDTGTPEVSVGVGSTQYMTIVRSTSGGASAATIQLAYSGSNLVLTGQTNLGAGLVTTFALNVTSLTLAQIQTLINGQYTGWTCTINSPAYNTFLASNLDVVFAAQSCLTTAYGFAAGIYELQAWASQTSKNVNVVIGSGNDVRGVPSSLSLTAFGISGTYTTTASSPTITTSGSTLGVQPGMGVSGTGITAGTQVLNVSGTTITLTANATSSSTPTLSFIGIRGTSTNSSVQSALNSLLSLRVNFIVPLFSSDNQDGSTVVAASVFAALSSHLSSRGSILGKSEAQGFIGVSGTLTTFKSTCSSLNNRWLSVTSQKITDVNVSGVSTLFPEYGLAVVAAQTMAGSPIGTPLTYRQIPSTGITQNASWTPSVNGAEVILAGGLLAGPDENNVLRFINGDTCWLGDSNDANIKNESVYSLAEFAFNHRLFMKQSFLGQSNYTESDVISAILKSLDYEVNVNKSIKGYNTSWIKIFSIGNELNYQVNVIPFIGTDFVLPVIIATFS